MAVTINGSAGVTTNSGAVYDSLQRGTSITLTNQTAPEFTGIPSWVKRVTLIWNGVSTNGSSSPLVQLGTSSGYATSGYTGSGSLIVATVASSTFTTGFGDRSQDAAAIRYGAWVITNISGNIWVCYGNLGRSDGGATSVTGGSVTLSGTLDRLRLYIDGTQQFDAGTINIIYE